MNMYTCIVSAPMSQTEPYTLRCKVITTHVPNAIAKLGTLQHTEAVKLKLPLTLKGTTYNSQLQWIIQKQAQV